jgi:hypothetical protein
MVDRVEVRDFKKPQPSDIFNINPEGCWNWWGYAHDSRYLFKDGVQVGAIRGDGAAGDRARELVAAVTLPP